MLDPFNLGILRMYGNRLKSQTRFTLEFLRIVSNRRLFLLWNFLEFLGLMES